MIDSVEGEISQFRSREEGSENNHRIDKIRLTGGEPTIRANVIDLVRQIAANSGVRSLSMTTNGVLLGKLAVL